MRDTWVPSLGQEDPLAKEMATRSSILGWKIPWTGCPRATVYRVTKDSNGQQLLTDTRVASSLEHNGQSCRERLSASLRTLAFIFLGLLSRVRTAAMQGRHTSAFTRNGSVFHVTVPLPVKESFSFPTPASTRAIVFSTLVTRVDVKGTSRPWLVLTITLWRWEPSAADKRRPHILHTPSLKKRGLCPFPLDLGRLCGSFNQ